MSVRFQADADLNHIIVKATLRREPSIDFQTAHVANLAGIGDQEVWALAARVERQSGMGQAHEAILCESIETNLPVQFFILKI